MPVRSLSSRVVRWPDAAAVRTAAAAWAEAVAREAPEVLRVGYRGSYARGDWGVGSDLDLVVVVERSGERFERRAAAWDTTDLPVPVDLLVYAVDEWDRLRAGRRGTDEPVWLYERR